MHLRLVPKEPEPAGCVPCAQQCFREDLTGFCMCDCHIEVVHQQLVLTEEALARAYLRMSGLPVVRSIK